MGSTSSGGDKENIRPQLAPTKSLLIRDQLPTDPTQETCCINEVKTWCMYMEHTNNLFLTTHIHDAYVV